MKLLYEAANTIEAHMILGLLEQAGLTARIDGEYLQGGIGELQAIGVVRVMINEGDHGQGKSVLEAWDANQPSPEPMPQIKKENSYLSVLGGFVAGIIVMVLYCNTPMTDDGIDYNGDGSLDEKWKYVNYRMAEMELDRNLDAKLDLISKYDRKGLIESSKSDDDFNGTFETQSYYKNGSSVWLKSDTTGDGFKDYRIDFKHGLINTVSYIDPITMHVIKVEHYGSLKLESAELDTNRDGILDTVVEYDEIGEITKKYAR